MIFTRTAQLIRSHSLPLLAAALILSSSHAYAASADFDSASAMIKKGDYAGAVPLLRAEAEKHPDDPRIAYYLGMALNRSRELKEAESVLKSALMTMPDDPALNLELGMLYFNKEISDEATDYFEQTMELAPGTRYATEAGSYLKKIGEQNRPKPWKLNLTAGTQYDSNVMLNGNNQPLPQAFSGKSDWSAVLNAGGSYGFLRTSRFEASASYNLYQNLHNKLHDFDVSQHLLEAAATYSFSSALRLKGSYCYEYLFLGGDGYDYANIGTVALTHYGSNAAYGSLEYRYRDTVYKNSPMFPENTDRSGSNNSITATYLFPLEKLGSIWGSYALEYDRTKRSFWDYLGNRFLLGVQVILPFNFSGTITGEFNDKRYEEDDPAFSTTRNDKQYTLGVSLTSHFLDHYSITLGEVYIRNDSNIGLYDYDRSLTSLMFTVRL